MLITNIWSNCLLAQEQIKGFSQPVDSTSSKLNLLSDSIIVETSSDSALIKVDTSLSKDAIESTVSYKAKDSMRFDLSNEKVYLYGNAQVNYENIQLNADYIEVDLASNVVTANGIEDSLGEMQGLPIFKEGAQEYEAGKMTYNFDTKKGKISEVKTQEGEGFIKGNEVKKTGDDVMYIRNGYYTTCNHDEPHFSLSTTKLKIIPNDKIVTGPTILKIGKIPTPLGLPFGFFPNKKGRSSGIVIPTYGDSRALGFFLRNGGFYFGLSEFIDITLTGDVYSLGSYGGNFNSRYKKRYQYNGNLNLSFANIQNSYEEFPDFSESKEFFIRWTHAQDPKSRPGSRFSANVNAGTRSNFTNNLNSFTQDYLTNTFQSSVSYTNSFPSKPFNLTLSARHNQNTQTGAFNINLPDAAFNVSRLYPFKQFGKIGNEWWRSIYKNFGLSYSSVASNQLRTVDTLISINRMGELQQEFTNGVRHAIPINTSFKLLKYFNLNPSFNYSEIWNFTSIRENYEASTNTVERDTIAGLVRGGSFNFNTALTTKVYGMFQFKKGKIQAIRHVMTPQISFNYQPEVKTGLRSYQDGNNETVEYSIFEGGIYGRPNRTESGRLGLNLLNNLEMKVRTDKDSSGTKKITIFENLGFSSSFNTAADSLNWSNVIITGRTRIGKFLTLQFNGGFDPYGLDTSGRKINTSWNEQTGKIARLTNGNLALNLNLRGGNKKQKEPKKSELATDQELEFINANPEQFIDFSIPWSLNIGYNIRYSKPAFEQNVTQTLNFSGDLSLTEKWKIGFTSGWDFEREDLTYTSVNINRDLHCWQMAINWVPYGPRQSYMITINVKSQVLQDLKLNRRRDYYDLIN